MKKIKMFIVTTALVIGILVLTGCNSSKSIVYDDSGDKIGNLSETKLAYLEVVREEAIEIISEAENCTQEDAKKKLNEEKYYIYTFFNDDLYEYIQNTYEESGAGQMDFGCSITTIDGKLVAAYSAGNKESNFAVEKNSPYSAIKPISVYAPYFEKGGIYWSKMYEDSPIKTITHFDGSEEDWPSNANNTYLYEDVPVCQAIKQSLNTIAVKCLQEYGVRESIGYMEENFGINLEYEKAKLNTQGESEVLGNIALGYLEEGVSTVDMAGYYQVFANGGKYQKPKTILRIDKEGGETVYEFSGKMKQVVSEETAHILNRLLQEVVDVGGTGFVDTNISVDIGGKTGTGPEGNWFVGFSPEYCAAVWHGTQSSENIAATIFSDLYSKMDLDDTKEFPHSKSVEQKLYCEDSGQLMSGSCKKLGYGYYISNEYPSKCESH